MKDPNFMELARDIINGRMCNQQALFCQIVESLVTVYELGKKNKTAAHIGRSTLDEYIRLNIDSLLNDPSKGTWNDGYINALNDLTDFLDTEATND